VSEPLTVLYVEDNDANYTLCKRVLETTGLYRVTRADSAEQAMEQLSWLSPAAILLDLDLPGMNGIELAKHLKTRPHTASIPIIIITASVMALERKRALEAGAVAFVEKPFDIEDLRVVVADVLRNHGAASPPASE
jgi:CheY-like chemotaxis protein